MRLEQDMNVSQNAVSSNDICQTALAPIHVVVPPGSDSMLNTRKNEVDRPGAVDFSEATPLDEEPLLLALIQSASYHMRTITMTRQ